MNTTTISNLLLRELANNALFLLLAFLAVLIAVYLAKQARFPGWREMAKNQMAIGMLFLCGGMALNRGYSIFLTFQFYHGRTLEAILTGWVEFAITYVGTVIAIIGAACLGRVLAPSRWGHWSWMVGMPLIGLMAWVLHWMIAP